MIESDSHITNGNNEEEETPSQISDQVLPQPDQVPPLTQVPSPTQVPLQIPTKKKSGFKRIITLVLLLGVGYLAWTFISLYLSPDNNIQQVYLVPKNAALIIQTSDPVKDWRKFSNSAPWQSMKGLKAYEEITGNIEFLDSMINANKSLLSLVGKRSLMISLHKTRPTDFDFLIIVDMQKVSKMYMLRNQIENILFAGGYSVTKRKYNDVEIIEMRDNVTREILYGAFVENHFVISYTSKLLEASIDERNLPHIGLEQGFMEVDRMVAEKGLCRVFINYDYLPEFLSIFMGQSNPYFDMFCEAMNFAGLYGEVDDNKIDLNGYTLLKDQTNPYIAAILGSGNKKMTAHKIMPFRTAFYGNVGFEDPVTFVKELENAMSVNDKKEYDDYKSTKSKLENYFDISLEKHFLSWMDGEFAFAQTEPGLIGREAEVILAIRAKDVKSMKENMALIEKRIRSKTPIRINAVTYKGYPVNYVEMKGFFRLFFGGLFDRFEKPYYTYVDDYVIFSTKPSTILSFIEDYEQKNLMINNEGFDKAYIRAKNSSTLFAYLDISKFYPLLKPMFTTETWKDIEMQKDVIYSFPFWQFQVVGSKQAATISLTIDHIPFVEKTDELIVAIEQLIRDAASDSAIADVVDDTDEVMDVDAESETELMNELQRFYVEKFEGNILREYYDNGSLKSESETKSNQRHGRYRVFYESGTLMIRGKYAKGSQKGTWKYYTPEGKFDRKERY